MTGGERSGMGPASAADAGAAAAGPEATGAPAASLRDRALRGVLWTTGGFGAGQLIRLGSNLVITRLLFPEAFGLMAIVNAFLAGLAMFSDLGLAPSIVQSSRGDDPKFLDTAWSLQIVRGIGLWILACALAWPVAAFYEQSALLALLPAAGISVLISGFNSTSLLRLRRHLAVAKLTLVQLAGQVSAVAVMLGWALIHPTVWALVAGGVASSSVKLVLSHAVVAIRRDRLSWDRGAARDLFQFGKWIFASTILAFLVGQSDRLIFGKVAPLAMLGVYSIAQILANLPSGIAHRIANTVVFPAFSRKGESAGDFASAYHRSRRSLVALGGLAVAALAASGPPLIETLYDPRYVEAGWILQLLAIEAWIRILEVPTGSALLALGLPRWLAIGNALKLAGMLTLIPLGYWLYGFPGAIGGLVATEALRYAACAMGVRRQGLPAAANDLLATLLLVAAAGCGWYASLSVGASGGGRIERLAAAVLVASLAWLPIAGFMMRREGPRLVSDLRSMLR
jgi:O-antigen/teichoic acid export membrane protein